MIRGMAEAACDRALSGPCDIFTQACEPVRYSRKFSADFDRIGTGFRPGKTTKKMRGTLAGNVRCCSVAGQRCYPRASKVGERTPKSENEQC